jgi:hippurate hydrolase
VAEERIGEPGALLAALERHRATYVDLRRDLHAHPETAYQEHRTAALVARELGEYGLEVHQGLGGTGVVGVLRCGTGNRAVGLRADMDALSITERTGLPHQSGAQGKMHACGHDGHTAMLLLAARHLSESRSFDGTAVFIFQPAEEGGAGAKAMIEDGLLERFPVEAVFGMHNIPGIPVGQLAVMPGAMMASGDAFRIVLTAPGGHAAMPHTTPDPILAGSALVQEIQSIVSRALDPLEPAVVSVTQFHGGEATNVIPATVTLQGTARSFTPEARRTIEAAMRRLAEGVARGYGLDVSVEYRHGYPPTVNTPREAELARGALERLVGPGQVLTGLRPLMTSEDFAYMLQARPGAYLWIGNGDTARLHTPLYDFNDDVLTLGAAAWVRIVEEALPAL